MTTETPECSTVGCEEKPYQRFQAKVADEDGGEEWINYSTCRAHKGEVLQELFAHISRRINLADRVVEIVDYDPIARESI